MKRVSLFIICLSIILTLWAVPVCGDTVPLFFNDTLMDLNPPAVRHFGEVYVEAQSFLSLLGISAEYQDSKVEYSEANSRLYLSIGSDKLVFGDKVHRLWLEPLYLKDHIYISIRDLAKILDFSIFHKDHFLSLTSPYMGAPQKDLLPRYWIEAVYTGGKIYGNEIIDFTNDRNQGMRDIFLALPAAAVNRESKMKIHNVLVNGLPAVYEAKETYLMIDLPFVLEPFDSCRVEISFDTTVPEGAERLGRSGKISILTCWYPVIPLKRIVPAHVSYGEPYSFKAAKYDLEFTVDVGLQVMTGLDRLESLQDGTKTIHRFKSEGPIRDLSLVVGSFDIKKVEVEGVSLVYAFKDYDEEVITHGAGALKLFQKWWGEYPYTSLTLVDVPLKDYQGMEYGGLLLLSTINRPSAFVIAHEVSHQWWYGLVGNNQDEEAWIDEGLANYSAILYFEELMGKKQYDYFIKSYKKRSQGNSEPIKKAIVEFETETDYSINAYIRGALFWHDVRKKIGKGDLLNFLAYIQKLYRHGAVTTEEIKFLLKNFYPYKF
ncbi:MAG: M1 family metallopeptidase [Clostridia bacterium]|nr:M1 family metallopeptidase [Clostridia bacterium]